MSRPRRAAVHLLSHLVSGSGAGALLRRRRRARGDHRLWVLEYHDVGGEREGAVSANRLARHLSFLRRQGYRFETLGSAAARLAQPTGLDADRVVITFDDGYAGNHRHAWPVLRAAGVPATIFVTTGFLDGGELWFDFARRALTEALRRGDALPRELSRPAGAGGGSTARVDQLVEQLKYLPPERRRELLTALRVAAPALPPAAEPLSWDQVRELHAGGIEIGCHTMSHPILSTLSGEEQHREIVGARDRIAAEIGSAPTSFAFPNGTERDFDSATLSALRTAGFRAACTTLRGSNRPGCDPLTLRRIGVGRDSTAVLAARLAGLFDEGLLRRRAPRVAMTTANGAP